MDDFLSAAAHELAAAIRRREVSSVEIVSAISSTSDDTTRGCTRS